MKNSNIINVSDNSFGFTQLTRKIMTKYIGIMYEDNADFSDVSIRREYHFMKDSNNLMELLESHGMAAFKKRLIINFLGNMYEDNADYSDESIKMEFEFLNDNGNLHDLFQCDWVFSEEYVRL